jgi:Mrp family chromosome partitioning ATPase
LIRNLSVLTAGSDVPNPAEILARSRLGETIEEVRSAYDVVIIDSSPLLAVSDPWIIAAVTDGILLVIRLVETRRQDVEQTMELIGTLGIPLLGVLINGVTRGQLGYGYSRPYGAYPDPPRSVEGSFDPRDAKAADTNGHHRILDSPHP